MTDNQTPDAERDTLTNALIFANRVGHENAKAYLTERLRANAAEAEVARLHTWAGLLSLLDEHWPEETFPTLNDDPKRDTGPRLVAALRRADEAEADVGRLRAKVARVEALAKGGFDIHATGHWVVRVDDIRAALAEPERDEEGKR